MPSKTLTLATLGAALTTAQIVSEPTTNSNPIQLTATDSTVLPFPIPTSFISLSNHIPGTQSTNCATVTMQGEPMFTIQTDTVTPSACTYTVFSASNDTSMVVPTFSSLPVPVAPGPVVTAANGTNATMTGTSTGGMMSSSGMVGGGGMSTSGSGSGTSTMGGGSGGSGSGSSSSSGASASQTDSAASINAVWAGEAVGLAVVGAVFLML